MQRCSESKTPRGRVAIRSSCPGACGSHRNSLGRWRRMTRLEGGETGNLPSGERVKKRGATLPFMGRDESIACQQIERTVVNSLRCEEREMNATYSCQMANVNYGSSPLSCLRRTSPLRSGGIDAEWLMYRRERRGGGGGGERRRGGDRYVGCPWLMCGRREKDAEAVTGMLAALDLCVGGERKTPRRSPVCWLPLTYV